ncbi:MAG: bifunctional riboflavin kinase/FAD synthetase [Bacteroidaceae bacterium]|nr:bifunctional riboflavin kinase/FAD synthetase [Bacteroidaceae bacterium]
MKTIYLSSPISTDTLPPSTQSKIVATIGFFDGVHRGHQHLISQVRREAVREGALAMVVTFDRHPRQVLDTDYRPQLLTSLDDKLFLLSKTGIDIAVVVPFDKHTAAMTAQQFMLHTLKEQCHVSHLIVGYDNRFGNGRTDTPADYASYGRLMGIEVSTANAIELNGKHISSSVVRHYLQQGEVEMAQQCLGHPYFITGTVTEGDREGRKLGFPTANIVPHEAQQLIPANGVYSVKVRLPHSVEMKRGIMNIGTRPTFGTHQRTLEAHILQFDDDLYGQELRVAFVHRIREEQTFDSPEHLMQQIQEDKELATQQFDKDNDPEAE